MAQIPNSGRYRSTKSTGYAQATRPEAAPAPEAASSIIPTLVALGVFAYILVKSPLIALGLFALILVLVAIFGKR